MGGDDLQFTELLLLAIGLAMDASAVSMSNGMSYLREHPQRTCWILSDGICFGLMQGLMPLIGYWLASFFSHIISAFDHYIALILLGFIGAKMIWEALHESDEISGSAWTIRLLLLQGVATSIDALAVGVSFAAFPDFRIWTACALIAGITCALSILGCVLGQKFGSMLGNKAQIFGGIILIGIGCKIFIEHMWFP